jgi:aryl-phospho-beta-D-glucosidase BglC (GH1 family)
VKIVLLAALLASPLLCLNADAKSPSSPPDKPPMLKAVGSVLKNPKGETVRLQGVNIASLEWSNEGDRQLMRSVKVAMEDWNANAIRLPVAQDRWFGRAPGQSDGGEAYRKIVDGVIEAVSDHSGHVLLDLHWSDAGTWGESIAQHKMPDDNSLAFWKDAAKRYANDPAVLFDLYNEPHDVSWDVWKNGGDVTEKIGDAEKTYASPGMQKLLDAVRSTGAKNLIVAGGLDWAYDLTGIANGYALKDEKGNGVIYSAHIYPWKKDWEGKVGALADRYPVLVGEVGCKPEPKQEDPMTWAPKVLAFIEKHRLSWTAWCFHPSASPCLLSNWDYDPTPYWGAFVKADLMNR